MATNHSYLKYTYLPTGGTEKSIHILSTAASNIILVSNISDYGGSRCLYEISRFGINGSFFQTRNQVILNIATNNGVILGSGSPDDAYQYNNAASGEVNTIGRGAVGWNGSTLRHYTDVIYASDIAYSSNNGTWVQGGIALWLGYNQWQAEFEAQPAGTVYSNDVNYLSALIANTSNNEVYLIKSDTQVSVADFRATIQGYLNIVDSSTPKATINGILLDGGRSAQIRAKNSSNTIINHPIDPDYLHMNNELRRVPQIVALKNSN